MVSAVWLISGNTNSGERKAAVYSIRSSMAAFDELRALIANAMSVAVFTGVGISTGPIFRMSNRPV
jgi:hypothetical protein